MSEYDEILDEISGLERKIDNLANTFIACTTDMLEAMRVNSEMIAQLGEVMALANSPTEEDLQNSATLREAYDRYDFVRKLAVGDNK
jgi:hypothetical protein